MDDPKIMNIMNGMKSLEDHCQLISDVKGKWPVPKIYQVQTKIRPKIKYPKRKTPPQARKNKTHLCEILH